MEKLEVPESIFAAHMAIIPVMIYRGFVKIRKITSPDCNLSYNTISVWITILVIISLFNMLLLSINEMAKLRGYNICSIIHHDCTRKQENLVIEQIVNFVDVLLILTSLTQAYEWMVMNYIVNHQKVKFTAEIIEEMQNEDKKHKFENAERKQQFGFVVVCLCVLPIVFIP